MGFVIFCCSPLWHTCESTCANNTLLSSVLSWHSCNTLEQLCRNA